MRLVINVSNTLLRRALGAAAISGLLAGAYFIGSARADGIPTGNAIFYSGLLEESGVPAEGDRSVVIRLFDAPSAGTERCTTTLTATFTAGRFRVPLVGACTAAIHTYADLFAEVSVGVYTLPRTKLGAVPYAVEAERATQAQVADDANLLGGSAPSAFATAAHNHDTGAITSGTLPINRGGTGINTVTGNANRVLGANSGGTGYELKAINGTSGQIAVTQAPGAVALSLAAGVPRGCSYESNSTATQQTQVTCPAGKYVVGGGGACAPSNDQGQATENRMKYTRPLSNRTGWETICTVTDGSKSTYSYAICCTE
ncbi:MAG: hypothetical protein HYS27_10070 [Deltaproteobacteria bacterium]|nr:hypothetical protein [Deltaproteobacteria bacterium]